MVIITQRRAKKPRMTKQLTVSKVFATPKMGENETNPEIFTRLDFVQYEGEQILDRVSVGDFEGFTLANLPEQIKKIIELTDGGTPVKIEATYYQSAFVSKKTGAPGIANRSSLSDLNSWKIVE